MATLYTELDLKTLENKIEKLHNISHVENHKNFESNINNKEDIPSDIDTEYCFEFPGTLNLANWAQRHAINGKAIEDLLIIINRDFNGVVPKKCNTLLQCSTEKIKSIDLPKINTEMALVREPASNFNQFKIISMLEHLSNIVTNNLEIDSYIWAYFPLTSINDLMEIERKINNFDTQQKFINFLKQNKPKNFKTMRLSLEKLLSIDFLLKVNWSGKGGFIGLSKYQLFNNVLLEAWKSDTFIKNKKCYVSNLAIILQHIKWCFKKKHSVKTS